eukprot:TRINITY_DN1287_c0_g1_i1.p1 TRINITY_DN1287_c0_g1~~TRINITY_DN1287_c0_g1_i1.p1  ORF type:complete len:210 (-),score=41.86 TRINITY_DN1287_c0_g1_i1:246-875(-)
MSRPKLTFFPTAGRAEVSRLAFVLGGVDFDDVRLSQPQWQAIKANQPFLSLPVLEWEGYVLTQNNAIHRFVGKRTGLWPTDEWQSPKADEILDAVEDVIYSIGVTNSLQGDAKVAARKQLATEKIPIFFNAFEKLLEAAGGQFFAGGKLTVADLKVYVLMNWLQSGILDHIPADVLRGYTGIQGLYKRIAEIPAVAAYREKNPIPSPQK